MVLPMEKLSLLIFHEDYRAFLEELRDRGVVHVHENKKKSAENERLKQKLQLVRRITEIIRLLDKRPLASVMQKTEKREMELLAGLEERYKRIEQIEQQIVSLEKEGGVYEPWGVFPRNRIRQLEDAGWDLRFFTVPDRKYNAGWEERFNAFVVNQEKGQTYFVSVMPAGDQNRPAEADSVVFPVLSAEEIQEKVEVLREERNTIAQELDGIAVDAVRQLKDYRLHVYEDTDELKLEDASLKLVDEKVIALEGWVPEGIKKDTEQWLAEKGVCYEFEKPTSADNPPILLKNNRFARLFEFIGELYSLPNYRELDLTPFFAPFFVLFFGFCLGDSGYGLLILLGVSLYKIKAKPAIKPILSLAQWLGLATVVMGIVGGTFFGIQLLEVEVPWVVRFRSLMLDSQQLFNLALIIGVVQIIFGMFLKVANLWKQYGFPATLSTIGWLVLILGEGICYLLMTKGYEVRTVMYVIGGVAGVLIFLLNNLKRNVFINVGAGLWDAYNALTGFLGDVLSYIRLFALGISGAVLGLVFNELAVNMSGALPPVLKQLVMLVILLFGHSINLFMAGLGSFVHPMRLTFVEFYKNAGFEGGGKKYQPFCRRREVE